MRNIEQTGVRIAGLALFGLASLSASGLAGAHGAPESEGVPEGIVKARITDQPDIPGLSAIILDAPRPGILLRYQGAETVTVLGTEEEDFLRFSQTNVMANPQSPSWQALPNSSTGSDHQSWQPLSQSGSFGWLDPRLNTLEGTDHKGEPRDWKIKIRTTGGDTAHIRGTLTYVPISQSR
jgi:hypothetical protein